MALKLGELYVKIFGDKTALNRNLAESKAEVAAAGSSMDRSMSATALSVARSWATSFRFMSSSSRQAHRSLQQDIDSTRRRLRSLSQEFGRTRNTSLLGDIDRERSKLAMLERAASDLGRGGFAIATQTAGALVAAVISVGSNVLNLVGVLLIAAAAIAAVEAAGQLLGGVLGAIPALTVGALGGIGTLVLGLHGMADAFRDSNQAGGAAVDRTRQIMLAHRQLRDALKESRDATEDLTRARRDAQEQIEDLNLALNRAHLDERAAARQVELAARDLTRARLTEDPARIKDAQLAYEQAQQSVAEVKDRVEDLTEQQQEAGRKGVEGSDRVQSALERQRRAVEAVSDAHYALQQAQQRTAAGAAQQATVLAASAREVVDAIKSLRGEYSALRLMVQQRLFAGIADEIKSLSSAWMPTLQEEMGNTADMFNGLMKKWAETSRDPVFINNIASGWESVNGLIDKVVSAAVGPGLQAFGQLARAAGPFIDHFGDALAGIIDDFAEWIDEADRSGALTQFFEDAGQFFEDTIALGKDVFSIIGSIISIILGTDKERKKSTFDGFREALHSVAEWLDDPKNQQKVRDFVEKITDFFYWLKDTAIPTAIDWGKKLKGVIDRIDEWGDRVKRLGQRAKDMKDAVVAAIDKIKATFTHPLGSGFFDPLKNSFRNALNWIIDRWNNLHFTLPGFDFAGFHVGGTTINTPDIPRLAEGAFVRPVPGGMLARVAEAGKPEWVLPDDKLARALDEAVRRGRAGGDDHGVVPEVHVYLGNEELKGLVRVEVREQNRRTVRRVNAGTGSR